MIGKELCWESSYQDVLSLAVLRGLMYGSSLKVNTSTRSSFRYTRHRRMNCLASEETVGLVGKSTSVAFKIVFCCNIDACDKLCPNGCQRKGQQISNKSVKL